MIEHRKLNVAVGYLGSKGVGKTYLASRHLEAWQGKAYVVVHDPTGSVSIQGAHVVRTIEEGTTALRTDPSKAIVIQRDNAARVIRLALALAARSLESARQSGTYPLAWPVVLYLDEAVRSLDVRPQYLSETAAFLLTQARHEHVLFMWSTQSPKRVHYEMIDMSSDVFLFRCVGARARARLLEADIPDTIVNQVPKLPNQKFIHYQIGSIHNGANQRRDDHVQRMRPSGDDRGERNSPDRMAAAHRKRK